MAEASDRAAIVERAIARRLDEVGLVEVERATSDLVGLAVDIGVDPTTGADPSDIEAIARRLVEIGLSTRRYRVDL